MGSSGTGTISHLFLERLKRAAGVDITHVPYRGGSLAIQDLSAGAIDMMFDAIPALLPHIREGRFRPLAAGSAGRITYVPELAGVPGMDEAMPGAGIDALNWWSVVAPAGTPEGPIRSLHAALARVMADAALAAQLRPMSFLPTTDPSPEAFGAFWRAEEGKWRDWSSNRARGRSDCVGRSRDEARMGAAHHPRTAGAVDSTEREVSMTAASRYAHPDAIVNTSWLADNLRDPALRVFDCTTYLRYETGRAGRTGSRAAAPTTTRAHPRLGLPGPAGRALRQLGQVQLHHARPRRLGRPVRGEGHREGTRAVLYSRGNMQWATRVWWMLRAVGFDDAAVLDGGFDKWSAEGRPAETAETLYPPASLAPRPRPGLFVGKDEVKAAIGAAGTCTVNALAPDLHRATTRATAAPAASRERQCAGAGPAGRGSLTLKPPEAVAAAFAAAGADPSKRILLYCGGGIAATLDAFLLHQLGYRDVAVYDASMSEWAKDETLPIERG
jgi:thiosulfate/3-mercaptopyruvate sulfurtransferase